MPANQKDFASCVITDDCGKVLLVRRTYGSKAWSLPGGVVEDDEPAWVAVKRECREELGVEIECSLAAVYFMAHRNAYGFVFRATSVTGVPAPSGDEIDAIGYFDPKQLPATISNFTIQRIEDVLRSGGTVCLGTQHISDYRVGDPKNIRP